MMQDKNISEKELIVQLQNSKTQDKAFRELMGLYKERLYWHIRKIVLNHEDADDVLQNTFVKVYRNISKFKGESKLYSWLYRIASNEAITFLNKKAKQKQSSLEDYQQELASTLIDDVYFEGDEIQQKLFQAIATLPNKQQEVFRLKYFEELKYNEIASILEKSVGGLKASYHLAVKKIETFIKHN
jgi:RNA polymerase sigma-70 factor (ECF subfamily)